MIRQYGHVPDLAIRSSTITCIKSRSPHPLTFSISALVTTSIPFKYDVEVGLLAFKFLTWIQFNSNNSLFLTLADFKKCKSKIVVVVT